MSIHFRTWGRVAFGIGLLLALVLSGCGWIGKPTPTPLPASPTVTATVRPTGTPTVTATVRPTVTPGATRTPRATATAFIRPTRTPAPTSTATATPFPEGSIQRGWASHYAPGVFERVVAQHVAMGFWDSAPEAGRYAGFAATESCEFYRSGIWLRSGVGEPWGLYLVADCAGDRPTVEWMQANNILVEVDAATYERWRAAGYWTRRGMPVEWALGDE